MKAPTGIIERLNIAISMELGASNQYWIHQRLLKDWGFTKLAEKERAESLEEREHADRLIARVVFLEGIPNLQDIDEFRVGTNIKEVLEADLAGECDAVAYYTETRRFCEEQGDFVTMALFDELLADEEGHCDFLETQLQLLENIGEEKYALLNAGSANEGEA